MKKEIFKDRWKYLRDDSLFNGTTHYTGGYNFKTKEFYYRKWVENNSKI